MEGRGSFSPRPSDYSSYPTPSHHPGDDADDELDDDDDRSERDHYNKMMFHSELFYGEDSENTSESSSGRNSPAPSVYSYHSSIDGSALLRDLHGRVLNSTSEVGFF